MNTFKGSKNIFMVTGLIGGMGIFLILAYSSFARQVANSAHITAAFERAKMANYHLNEDILRLRTFSLRSYDPIVGDIRALKQTCNTMRNDEEFASLHKGRAQKSFGDYCAAIQQKVELVETYKSKHSVLKNSLKFLPMLLVQSDKTEYAVAVRMVNAALLNYNIEPEESSRARAVTLIANLDGKGKSAAQRELLASFVMHARIILKELSERQNLEEDILSETVDALLDQLHRDYVARRLVNEQYEMIYHYLLIFTCLALGGGLFLVFRRLSSTGEKLLRANETLESNVAVRTTELSQALMQLEQNQQILIQSAKMTALGEMAGGIAHEINSPLGAILLNAEAVLEDAEETMSPTTLKRLDSIIKIVERVSRIILGLRKFSRQSDPSSRVEVPVATLISDTLELCSEKMRSNSIEVLVESIPENTVLNCVPEQISQVLMNFLNNSSDALKETVSDSARWIKIQTKADKGGVEISVTDAGTGISKKVQEKLMQPFFTTKPTGHGTGLGLSISKGIIEQHNGRLFYDKDCSNTRFVIQFPKAS